MKTFFIILPREIFNDCADKRDSVNIYEYIMMHIKKRIVLNHKFIFIFFSFFSLAFALVFLYLFGFKI